MGKRTYLPFLKWLLRRLMLYMQRYREQIFEHFTSDQKAAFDDLFIAARTIDDSVDLDEGV